MFADLSLSQRLERAEGYACLQFAVARLAADPDCGAEWMEVAGARAVFNGVDSPVTQSFGLGIHAALSDATLGQVERFFLDRGARPVHEVSPFAGVKALEMLCRRRYFPVELSSVMYRTVEAPAAERVAEIDVLVIGPELASVWADVNARGWAQDHPELLGVIREFGRATAAGSEGLCFLAKVNGTPGAAGMLWIHEGVALFGGSATVPELRRRGLQGALLRERMRYAKKHGCDLAMMVAEVGSNSQRNAEREGFQIAYTRTKWQLSTA